MQEESIKGRLARWAEKPTNYVGKGEFWAMSIIAGVAVAAVLALGPGDQAVENILTLMLGSPSSLASGRIMSAIGIAGPIVAGFVGLIACAAAIARSKGSEGFRMGHYALTTGAMMGSAALYFALLPLIELMLAAVVVFLVIGGLIAAALDG